MINFYGYFMLLLMITFCVKKALSLFIQSLCYLISYRDTENYHDRLGHSRGTLCFKNAAVRLKYQAGYSNLLPHVSKVRPHITW